MNDLIEWLEILFLLGAFVGLALLDNMMFGVGVLGVLAIHGLKLSEKEVTKE